MIEVWFNPADSGEVRQVRANDVIEPGVDGVGGDVLVYIADSLTEVDELSGRYERLCASREPFSGGALLGIN